jgi:opacity protein-like surface antigen
MIKMNRKFAIFFLLNNIIVQAISASPHYKFYTKLDGIYGFKNVCPSEITVTAATTTTTESVTVETALVPSPTISKSYIFAGAIGLDWDIGYRTELAFLHLPRVDYSYQVPPATGTAAAAAAPAAATKPSLTQFKYSITSIMANLILDLPVDRFTIPFVNAGVGYSRNYLYDFETYDKDMKLLTKINPGERWVLSWQVGAGLSFRLNHNLDLDIGYRHMYFDRLDSGTEQQDLSTPATPIVSQITAKSYGITKSHQIFIAGRIYF